MEKGLIIVKNDYLKILTNKSAEATVANTYESGLVEIPVKPR